MSGEATESPKQKPNLVVVREKLDRAATWNLRDVDPITTGVAFVFYLRSADKFKFRNALDEVVRDHLDLTVLVPVEMILRSADKTAEYVLAQAGSELMRAQSCV